jgi:hypothetical protein
MRYTLVLCALTAASFAQAPAEKGVEPWSGTADRAASAARSGATIPLATFSISPTKVKEKKTLTETIAGANPFSTPVSGSVINAVVVPIIFNIGGTIFDPTAPNSCDTGYSAINRFNLSPLVQPVPNLTFNRVNVGNVQYTDGFMRAEFWNAIGGNPAYSNPISWSTAAPVTITVNANNGITSGSGCTLMGEVSQSFLNTQIAAQLQALTQSGVISPTKLVLFLTNNVVGSSASPPTPPGTSTCCNWGYHTATGNPPQFYIFADYKSAAVPSTARDLNITIVSHEIAEFMNDPLLSNSTPAWGGIGSIPGCSRVLEVGDPLTAVPAPITMNGLTYNPQELAYFSWFFNSPTAPSLGAGGVFSSNGSLHGPSQPCPPGGTY